MGNWLENLGQKIDDMNKDNIQRDTAQRFQEINQEKLQKHIRENPASPAAAIMPMNSQVVRQQYASGGFVKMSSDKKKTVLKHKNGHELHIAHDKLNDEMKKHLDSIPHYDEGGVVSEQPEQAPAVDMPEQAPAMPQEAAAMPEQMQEAGAQMPENIAITSVPQQAPMQSPVQAEPYNKAIKQGEAAIRGQAKVEGQLGQAQAEQAQKQADYNDALAVNIERHVTKVNNEIESFKTDMQNNMIDPNRYMKSLSTSGQVATAFGLILGGMGAGVIGGENPAAKVLNDNINRDIEAQVHNQNQRGTLMNAAFRQFGNMKDAADFIRVATNEAYSHKLEQMAALSKDPMAKLRADQIIAEKRMKETIPLQQAIGYRQAIFEGMGDGSVSPELAVNALVPEPGARKDVINEIKQAQDMKKMDRATNDLFDQAVKENTIVRTGGGLRPSAAIPSLKAMMLPVLKDAAGRVSDQEMNAVEGFFPAPGDSDHRIETKRKAFMAFKHSKMSAPAAKSYGIDLGKFQSTAPMPNVRQNLNAPYGQK